MSTPHTLEVFRSSSQAIEATDAGFLRSGLESARDKTISVLAEIRSSLREGMNEVEARKHALDVFQGHGVTRHWHQPFILSRRATT